MATIRLALTVMAALPNFEAKRDKVNQLLRWDSEPKWQRLALLILEKHLTRDGLLMTSPAVAGATIADLLVENSSFLEK
jgi:hypothetical protein